MGRLRGAAGSALSYANLRRRLPGAGKHRSYARVTFKTFDMERIMGKYFLAWLLGVPGVVLLIIYLFFH